MRSWRMSERARTSIDTNRRRIDHKYLWRSRPPRFSVRGIAAADGQNARRSS